MKKKPYEKKPKKLNPSNSGCGKQGCTWLGDTKMIPLYIPLANAA